MGVYHADFARAKNLLKIVQKRPPATENFRGERGPPPPHPVHLINTTTPINIGPETKRRIYYVEKSWTKNKK